MQSRFRESRGVWLLIVVTAAVFLVDIATRQALTELGAKSSAIWAGQSYRLIAATFLHSGVTHIAFNLYALFVFGQVVERILGTRRFLALYLLSGATGYIASLLFSPLNLAVGASAAVFGLMGFTLHFRLRRLPRRWLSLDSAFVQIFGLNLVVGLMVPNIDHWAHVGGLLGGALAGSLLGLDAWAAGSKTGRRRETAAAAVIFALLFFVGLRPLETAQWVQRFNPSLGTRLDQRYHPFFLPYQVASPNLGWKYVDVAGDWDVAGEYVQVAYNRPVALALFWRWQPGATNAPGTSQSYEVVWKHNGNVVWRNQGVVRAPDERQFGHRAEMPALLGSAIEGLWEITVTMLDTRLAHVEAKIISRP